MKVIPLGVGGAFTEKYYHNNYIFDLGKRKLLVDAGTTFRYALKESDYNLTDITDILITHLHSDHVGGLEEIGQRCKFILNHKPTLWVAEHMTDDLFGVIRNGLETGFDIEDYFDVVEFEIGDYIVIGGYFIETIKTDGLHAKDMKSLGFKLHGKVGNNIIFTSDIANIREVKFDSWIDDKTVAVFHDCSLSPSPVHSHIDDIQRYYKDLSNFYMMHYQDVDEDVVTERSEQYETNFVHQGKSIRFPSM